MLLCLAEKEDTTSALQVLFQWHRSFHSCALGQAHDQVCKWWMSLCLPQASVAHPGTNSCSVLSHGESLYVIPQELFHTWQEEREDPCVPTAVLSSRQFYPLHLVIPKAQFFLFSSRKYFFFLSVWQQMIKFILWRVTKTHSPENVRKKNEKYSFFCSAVALPAGLANGGLQLQFEHLFILLQEKHQHVCCIFWLLNSRVNAHQTERWCIVYEDILIHAAKWKVCKLLAVYME